MFVQFLGGRVSLVLGLGSSMLAADRTSTSMRAFCMAASCCTWRMICILLSSAIVVVVVCVPWVGCRVWMCGLGGGYVRWGGVQEDGVYRSKKLSTSSSAGRSVARRGTPALRVERPLITSRLASSAYLPTFALPTQPLFLSARCLFLPESIAGASALYILCARP